MPKWIHERAQHLQAKNPSMPESEAWAISTQQAHAAGKSPKGYGTSEGRHEAKAKFDKPKKDYVQTANPKTAGVVGHVVDAARGVGRKITNADAVADLTARLGQQEASMHRLKGTLGATALVGGGTGVGAAAMHHNNQQKTAAEVVDGYSLAMFAGFSDEFTKIAGRFGEAFKGFGHYLAGGAKTPLEHTTEVPRGRLGKVFGLKPKHMTTVVEGAGPRVGGGLEALKNPATRNEALKVVGSRAALGTAAVGTGAEVSKKHHEHTNDRLGRAYMAGARDMYAQGQ